MIRTVVNAQCSSCSGTGLYEGCCEVKGEPVVCLSCEGTGCEEITYVPYTGRKKKTGVKCVHFSRGKFIFTGAGKVGDSMTYAEFEKKIKEVKP